MKRREGTHAVVIGASIAGLMAARVLSDYFEQITLLERDHFPKLGQGRKGAPQGHHAHGLLAQGRAVLDQFFPGMVKDLLGLGARGGDIAQTAYVYHHLGFYAQFDSGLRGLQVSRPLLEGLLRERVLALPNIKALGGVRVQGLTLEGERVVGVKHHADGLGEIRADVVVDASGRGSQTPKWLEAMGFARPQEKMISIDLAYATRIYRRRPQDFGGKEAMVIGSHAPKPRTGLALCIEDNRWIVSLGGFLGDHPPRDEQGFLEFAKNLATTDIYNLIQGAQPLSDISFNKFPGSQRRHYERLARVPQGLLVTGDAFCSLNPIYGQGMTVAMLEAKALSECLGAGSQNLTRRFFKKAAAVVDGPWSIAVGADLRYPQVKGPRNPMVHFVNWYVDKLHRAAHHDPQVTLALQKVGNLMLPPVSVLAPRIAWRVLRGHLFGPPAALPRVDLG